MALIEQRLAAGQAAELGESIEVFIDTRVSSSFIQLLLPVAGDRRVVEGGKDSARIRDGWSAKIRRLGDRWEVEMAVAWAVLADRLPTPDQVWGLNLNRTRGLDPDSPPFHCWSATASAFAEPDRFGNLVFASYPLWLRCHYGLRTGNLMGEIADLVMRYPESGKPFLAELRQLDKLWTDYLQALASPEVEAAAAGNAIRIRGDQVVSAYAECLSRLRLEIIKTSFR